MRYPCHTLIQVFWYRLDGFFMLNATFNNITVISWWSVLLVEGTGILGENHLSATSHWQTLVSPEEDIWNMCNNKIAELRTILQRKVKTHNHINRQISQQPENCENRNDPELVQAFLKKWWVESDFKAPNLQLSLRFKGSGCHYNSI
jgi:hypothetical protein